MTRGVSAAKRQASGRQQPRSMAEKPTSVGVGEGVFGEELGMQSEHKKAEAGQGSGEPDVHQVILASSDLG